MSSVLASVEVSVLGLTSAIMDSPGLECFEIFLTNLQFLEPSVEVEHSINHLNWQYAGRIDVHIKVCSEKCWEIDCP